MSLDPRTMLFSIVVVYALSVVSMYVAVTGRSVGVKRDGMRKWALAMFLETMLWMLISARGLIPDVFSIVLANGLKAASHALILAAILEFQQRQAPRWHYFVPVMLAMLMVTILLDDLKARIIWSGLIYGFQMVLIARALLSDKETRAGSAWRLLFAGVVGIALVLALRTAVGIFGQGEFAQPQSNIELHPVQVLVFIVVIATALMGTIGFVLLVKERADRDIMHLAMTDSLTQIPNRRALMDYAVRALARRSGAPLALLMIDVDLFKNINDTYGHPMGDRVLQKIAGLLEERLRGHDFLGRYGGEEFCVIAPDTDVEGALKLAEHLRIAIASASFDTKKGNISITISIGISLCPQNGTCDLKDVLANADAALYTAKQTGRNKAVCH